MAYDKRIMENMMKMEQHYLISGCYLSDEVITESMRQTLLEWMRDICQEENKLDQAFTHSVMLFDRFMQALKQKTSFQIHKSYLQLFATACLFLSSKVKTDSQLNALNLIEYTDNSITLSDLLESELFILETLEWDIDYIVPNDYFECLSSKIESVDKEIIQKKFYELTAKCSFDFGLQFYRPSQIATVCFLKALKEVSMFHLKDSMIDSINFDSQMNKLINMFELNLNEDSFLSESWSSQISCVESPIKKSSGRITKRTNRKIQRKNSQKLKKVFNSSTSLSASENDESMTSDLDMSFSFITSSPLASF